MAKPALGRGLGALLGGSPAVPRSSPAPTAQAGPVHVDAAAPLQTDAAGGRLRHVPLNQIDPCPFQPRKEFSIESLRELADSIREQGIVQPLVVRQRGERYELIAGERRWRAAQLLGWAEVPVLVREVDDHTALELALIENLQRENLNPLEEAQGYAQLIEQFNLTQEQVAGRVGKSRTVVTNALRLLKLPQAVQEHIRTGRLSVGHAKVILGLNGEKLQTLAANRILRDGLNVRQTEALVARLQAGQAAAARTGAPAGSPTPDAHVARLEDRLRERLGTKVHLRYNKGRGALEIAFFSDDELERLLTLLGISPD